MSKTDEQLKMPDDQPLRNRGDVVKIYPTSGDSDSGDSGDSGKEG